MNFLEAKKNKQEAIEQLLFAHLPRIEGLQKELIHAMHYSAMAGGKRLRPMLMQESYILFHGTLSTTPETLADSLPEPLIACMCALEYIHTYSLVHDDLPAMDNDEYRRGKKTTHIVYGEDIAILAGDALLNYAYETIAKAMVAAPDPTAMAKAFAVLSKKAGIYGMVGGQGVDVLNENAGTPLTMEEILFIHQNKTAALIEAALMCGALLAGAKDGEVALMEQVGHNIGLAFQIQDDILDVTATFEELGKPIGSDEKNQKSTYVSLVGLDEAKAEVEHLSKEALALLQSLPSRNVFLEELILSLIKRKN